MMRLGESYGQEMQTFLQQEDVCVAGTAVNLEEGEGEAEIAQMVENNE